ncbi:MAG: hypothetical protein H6896_07530 [Rhodovulum sp.]|nr:hypothetical protein [Rhodovulum sp.]
MTFIATETGSSALVASTCRRLQRFFQHVDFGPDRAVRIVARLVGSSSACTLALDRTTWKVGTRDVNHLGSVVVVAGFGFRCSGPCSTDRAPA